MTSPTLLHLTKHHGLGNDFLVVLEVDNSGLIADAELARTLCDRHRGIGADGLIFGLRGDGEGVDVSMVLYNADGSPAEISGNGIRCLAQAVLRHDGSRQGEIAVWTSAGVRHLEVQPGDDPAVESVRVDMGVVSDGPTLTAASQEYCALHRGSFDIGNPHLVLRVDSLEGLDPAVDGARLEAGYGDGMNVHFMVLSETPDTIELSHWERGVGVTEACGSGATVSAVAARRWGLVGSRVSVEMPGGRAIVAIDDDRATLIGPATFIARIEIER